MDLEIQFANPQQREFFYATERNQLFSGSFNNGKSFGGSLKAVTLLTTFPNYRLSINRQVRADLMKTTYQTFFKVCPKEYIEAQNLQEGVTYLKNGSRIDWLHLDGIDDSTLRGLELNSTLTDQAEEGEEKVYDILDARIGRWDKAVVPDKLIGLYPSWPKNVLTGDYIVPSYHLNLCNPDTQFHHLYRHYHPQSLERLPNHFYTEGEWDTKLGSAESYNNALRHADEWVQKYIRGQWGVSKAQIHRIDGTCILEPSDELLHRILTRGKLYRILDHGDASPTCCLWFAALDGLYICYREYYAAGKVVSYHREAIAELSKGEQYSGNYADPAIFKKSSQKDGGFWTTADEYRTRDIDGPPIVWLPADNNELATRNRINELLLPNPVKSHPTVGEKGAPTLYFIKRTGEYKYGCFHAVKELGSQRRKLLGYFGGEALYDDTREESVADHAYDCIRYFIAMHGSQMRAPAPKVPKNSLKYYKCILAMSKNRNIGRAMSS